MNAGPPGLRCKSCFASRRKCPVKIRRAEYLRSLCSNWFCKMDLLKAFVSELKFPKSTGAVLFKMGSQSSVSRGVPVYLITCSGFLLSPVGLSAFSLGSQCSHVTKKVFFFPIRASYLPFSELWRPNLLKRILEFMQIVLAHWHCKILTD